MIINFVGTLSFQWISLYVPYATDLTTIYLILYKSKDLIYIVEREKAILLLNSD